MRIIPHHHETGQALVLTVLSMTVLIGFAGLAIDVGLLFRAKRHAQAAADAAAIAGATNLLYTASGVTAKAAGKAASSANGITDGVNGASVTVNVPPVNGPNAGGAGFAEAIVMQPNPTIFMAAFSAMFANNDNLGTVSVGARAVAGTPGPSDSCVIVTNPTASDAMHLQGSFTVTAAKCGVTVDSNDANALYFTGAGGTLTAGSISVHGEDGGQTGDATPAPILHAPPVSDPLKLEGPVPPTGCTSIDSSSTTVTGNYAGPGAGNAVCFTKAITLKNVNLGNGIYVFENGMTLSGNVTTVTTTVDVGGTNVPSGATLDIYGGSMGIDTNTVLNLTAPAVGSTKGIALMEPPTNSSEMQIQFGNATGSLTGILYAPSAELYLQDSGGDKSGGISLTTDLIVNTLYDKTATLTINGYSQTYPTVTPLLAVTLVE